MSMRMDPRLRGDDGIIVLGKNGQVGRALSSAGLGFGKKEVDFAQANFTHTLTELTKNIPLKAVINASAYTQVDKAEGEGRALSRRINAEAVGELAQWCAAKDIPLVHYSTDYVFDGSGTSARKENAMTHPLNAYGEDKLCGEQLIAKSGAKHLILRTSWVYDAQGANFFNTMRRLFCEREEISVVADQVGAPTYAPHLAKASVDALNQALAVNVFPSGVYHLCHAGAASWFDFARAIFALARTHEPCIKCTRINAIETKDYPTPAKRPLNSRLDCTLAQSTLNVSLPDWQQGLAECVKTAYESDAATASRP